MNNNSLIESAEVSTDVLLSARDEVLASDKEVVFAIAGVVNGNVAQINALIPILGLETSQEAVANDNNGTGLAYIKNQFARRDDNRIGEAHSHLDHHQLALSSADTEVIRRNSAIDSRRVYMILKKTGEGKVSYRSFDGNGRGIATRVRSHVTGEVRVSDDTTPSSSFGKDFWGIGDAA